MKKKVNLPDPKFRIAGYAYRPIEKTIDELEFSIKHYLVNEKTGEIIEPDFTPWCYMSKIDVQNYVQLGYPARYHDYRPLSSTDLRKMTNHTNR